MIKAGGKGTCNRCNHYAATVSDYGAWSGKCLHEKAGLLGSVIGVWAVDSCCIVLKEDEAESLFGFEPFEGEV